MEQSRVITVDLDFYRDYLHCIANFCSTVLNIFSKQKNCNKFEVHVKHLKALANLN